MATLSRPFRVVGSGTEQFEMAPALPSTEKGMMDLWFQIDSSGMGRVRYSYVAAAVTILAEGELWVNGPGMEATYAGTPFFSGTWSGRPAGPGSAMPEAT